MKNEIIPVTTRVRPVIIPALCSKECQLNRTSLLYVNPTQAIMPVTVTTVYNIAVKRMIGHPIVPAIRKYASISRKGEKNIAIAKLRIILFLGIEV